MPSPILQPIVNSILISCISLLLAPFSGVAQKKHDHWSMAVLKDSVKEYTDEIQGCNRIIQTNPAMAKAWHLRGKAKYQLAYYRGAIADQQNAVLLKLLTEEVYLASAYSRLAIKQYREAIHDFSKAIAINPANRITWYHRGFTRQKLQQQKMARLDFSRANELGIKESGDRLVGIEPE